MIETSPYKIAERFIGMREIPGQKDNPQILAMLKLDGEWPEHDEIPWCGAFTNYIAWLLRLPRSKSLAARSWLTIGVPVALALAVADSDVVILMRGYGDQPGPEVVDAPGHVGFFSAYADGMIHILGGNQSNAVTVSGFDRKRLLGIRRLT